MSRSEDMSWSIITLVFFLIIAAIGLGYGIGQADRCPTADVSYLPF